MKHSEKVRLYENRGVSRNKTTACFRENDGSFYGKQRVVLWKTTCRFVRNNVSFYEKQRVVLRETTCRFVRNNVSFFRTQWRGNGRHRKVQIEKRRNWIVKIPIKPSPRAYAHARVTGVFAFLLSQVSQDNCNLLVFKPLPTLSE